MENITQKKHHLQTLIARHDALEEKVRQEQTRPKPNDANIQELKRQKLALKQEIKKFGAEHGLNIPS